METPRIYTLSIFSILAFSPFSTAQLDGCDAVGCPNDPASRCSVGNTTLNALGISEFNTTISPMPLTWTLGVNDQQNNFPYVERDYFLGTPPSLNLANSSTVRSCAFFFEGVSAGLNFPEDQSLSDHLAGTCNDALGAMCVSELMSQAQSEMKTILGTAGQNWTESVVCNAVQDKLQKSAPSSCQAAQISGWGTIMVRSLTGPEAAPASNQSDCHPTTGKDYSVSLVSSAKALQEPLSRGYQQLTEFIDGITPVMTIFYPYASGNNSALVNSPEVHLSCMKIVASTKNEFGPGIGGSGNMTGAAPETSCGNLIAMVGAVFVSVMLF